ncbi:MAG: phosphoglycerate kinase [Acidobacteria bacterium]|nr:MAG: phosphoglycerate kinase [Acidobacteriota bacterium]
MTVKALEDLNLANKQVLVRVDYNTPIADGKVADDSRIKASLPTLNYLLEQNCSVTLMSHLGRPKGQVKPEFSMQPVAQRLSKLIDHDVKFIKELEVPATRGRVELLENLRFHPGETKGDMELAKKLARFGEVYINDAFGTAHRAHASTHTIAALFKEKAAGRLLMKEIHYLRDTLKNPDRPFLAILGGSKVSDKIKLIVNLLDKVNMIAIGGAMSYTFLKAQGYEIGISRVEEDFLSEAKKLIGACEEKGIKLLLPLDHMVAKEFDKEAEARITLDQNMNADEMGLDIGPETINLYSQSILEAGTVVWNGPMGVFEWPTFSTGTISIADTLAESGCLSLVGGGDSVAAINQAQVADSITHISTGGGASLELLSGFELPGIKALEE